MHLAQIRSDPTFASRYECKYWVSPELASSIRQYVQPFVEPDPYAANRPGFRYSICSLYLDSPDLALYRQTVGGDKNRFKLRVRTYSDAPDAPIFFEVKKRLNTIVAKRRASVSRAAAESILADPTRTVFDIETDNRSGLDLFLNRRSLTAAGPVVKVRYEREAYQSRGGDPVRVTLDSHLSHAISLDGDLTHSRGTWLDTPTQGLILELKYTDLCPGWLNELVRRFGLLQGPVPKYVMSVEHMMDTGRASGLALGGVALPPWSR